MQRLITALMALFSLLAANLYPAGAQSPANEPMTATAPQGTPRPDAGPFGQGTGTSGFVIVTHSEKGRTLQLPAGQTVPNLVVRDTTLELAGRVTQDVMAINCHTLIQPGASVGNVLTAVGGTVIDLSGGKVRVVQQSAALLPELQQSFVQAQPQTGFLPPPSPRVIRYVTTPPGAAREDWKGGQFALLLLGGMAGLLALVVAPRATERTGESLALEPGRCLVVGAVGAGVMLCALAFSLGLMHSPFSPLLTPLGAGFAMFCLIALAFGWVCGMRYVGQRLTRRTGRRGAVGVLIQIGTGLGLFFLVNVLLGSVSRGLGVMGLLLEFTLALAGLGAALLSGFGTDPNWMTARLRGEVRWFSRTPRL